MGQCKLKIGRSATVAGSLIAIVTLIASAVPAAAYSLGRERHQLSFLESVPLWFQCCMVAFIAWVFAMGLSHAIWKWIDNAALASRISLGLFGLAGLAAIHFYIFELNNTFLIALGAVCVLVLIILWYSYSQLVGQAYSQSSDA